MSKFFRTLRAFVGKQEFCLHTSTPSDALPHGNRKVEHDDVAALRWAWPGAGDGYATTEQLRHLAKQRGVAFSIVDLEGVGARGVPVTW